MTYYTTRVSKRAKLRGKTKSKRPETRSNFLNFFFLVVPPVHSHGPSGTGLRRERGRDHVEDRHEGIRDRRAGHHRRAGQEVQHTETGDQRRVQDALRKGDFYDFM